MRKLHLMINSCLWLDSKNPLLTWKISVLLQSFIRCNRSNRFRWESEMMTRKRVFLTKERSKTMLWDRTGAGCYCNMIFSCLRLSRCHEIISVLNTKTCVQQQNFVNSYRKSEINQLYPFAIFFGCLSTLRSQEYSYKFSSAVQF